MTAHPIMRAEVSGFGPFGEVNVDFSPQLNVVLGDNGAGKSQFIKLLYSATATLNERSGERPNTARLSRRIASKLLGVFRPDSLGRLTNRRSSSERARVRVSYHEAGALEFGFSARADSEAHTVEAPDRYLSDTPAFIPTRELLSISPGLAELYDEGALEFDETWRDTALLLGKQPVRGQQEAAAQALLAPIHEALGGTVIAKDGRFYLDHVGLGAIEMHLVAEGLRKLGMIERLVSAGVLLERGYMFWDESEANLNPKTLQRVAETTVALAQSGVQVFIATHSLFLLREIEMLTQERGVQPTYIGLQRDASGLVAACSGPTVTDIGDISALDAEIAQSTRYLELA